MRRKNAKDILLKDLIGYARKQPQLVINRCQYAKVELAWQWLNWLDKKENPIEFYRNTDLYIFDLTFYQLNRVPVVDKMVEQVKKMGIRKILDFGGGIGEYTIRFIKETSAKVVFLEIKDSKTMSYAKYRFKKHKVSPKVIDETYSWQKEEWDGVVAMDVLEHLENPSPVISGFQKRTRYLWINPEEIKYEIYYPQHVSRYRLPGFERIEGYFWRNKKYGERR